MQREKMYKCAIIWLSGALLITLFGLLAVGYITVYTQRNAQERNALLFAQDLLNYNTYRQTTNDDSGLVMNLYEEMLVSRLSGLEAGGFDEIRPVLRNGKFYDKVAASLEDRSYSAAKLKRILDEFRSETKITSTPAEITPSSISTMLQSGASEIAAENWGLRFLREPNHSPDNAAFCHNIYLSFDGNRREVKAYTAAYKNGRKITKERYETEMLFKEVGADFEKENAEMLECRGGVCCWVYCSEKYRYCVGTRLDTGTVCFYLRSSKNQGNVLH